MKTKTKTAIAFVALVFFCIIAAGSMDSDPNAWKTENNSIMAYRMMTKFVSSRLKAPSTAVYPDYDAKFVTALDSNQYRISAYVDAQNSFGGMLRTSFNGTVKQTGDKDWELIDVDLNE